MLLNLICPKCLKESQRLFKKWEGPSPAYLCSDCQTPLERNPAGPSAVKKERLDNGLMPKAVERYDDAERLFRERSKNSS